MLRRGEKRMRIDGPPEDCEPLSTSPQSPMDQQRYEIVENIGKHYFNFLTKNSNFLDEQNGQHKDVSPYSETGSDMECDQSFGPVQESMNAIRSLQLDEITVQNSSFGRGRTTRSSRGRSKNY